MTTLESTGSQTSTTRLLSEKDAACELIDYAAAKPGGLRLAPSNEALAQLFVRLREND